MLFGEPGVDPRIQPLHRFPDEWDLPWASTYHSYQPHLGFRRFGDRGFAPDPYHCWAPDAELHAYAFVVPGNDHTSVVPEDWNGWLPPHPEQQRQNTAQSKSGRTKKKRAEKAKISEEVARRMQSQLQSATRGVSLRKIFGKYDADRSGTLTSTELKKLIRKELRISTAVISDSDVENLAAALDGDRTGNVSVEELLSFIERGSATFFSVAPPKEASLDDESKEEIPKSRDSSRENDDDSDTSEKKAPVGVAQHQSSKTILACTRQPYNRLFFRPLTPPLGGSLITLNTPRKNQRTRKVSMVPRAKDPQEEKGVYLCDESDMHSEPKADRDIEGSFA
ncbi:unnamed protein product [Durusdinium trenchii]|uniref:Uncharacterized protein n=2 Tax=Durusdinium trenchii TaxID=1381693 RepID=A0ABP0HAC7_9DINO